MSARGLFVFVFVATASVCAGACTRNAEPPAVAASDPAAAPSAALVRATASGAPAASATPAAGANTDASGDPAPPARDAAPPPPPTTWTSADTVAALARDCAWVPPDDEASREETPTGRPNALSCKFLLEQSCVPAPCHEARESTCKPKCTAACDGCGKRCVSACATCKKSCADAACKLACATSCGACHEACVGEADRCLTGTCNAQEEKCNAARAANLAKHRAACAKVCQNASECPGTCSSGADASGCMSQCRKRFVAAGCPEEFFGVCVMAGPGGLGLPMPNP